MTYTIFVKGQIVERDACAAVARGRLEFYTRHSANNTTCIDSAGIHLTLPELEQRIAASTQFIRQ